MSRHPVEERFSALREEYLPRVMGVISEVVETSTPGEGLQTMCAYHMETGGKRLRALLPLMVAEALGKEAASMVPFGAACEMLHNATLVHDDLQDGDRQRRGRDTVWARFGEARAINLGDAMFYYAVLLVQRVEATAEDRERASRRLLLETLRVIDGQEREFLLKALETPTLDDYFQMVEGKTSGLFALPVSGAADLCGASQSLVEALAESARHLGVLFQIQDDVLDLYGDKGRASRGSDIGEGKRSVLVMHALEKLGSEEGEELSTILDKPRQETSAQDISRVIELFAQVGSLQYALAEVARRRQAALASEEIKKHPRLAELVEGICELFLAPIRPLVESHGAGQETAA